MEKLKEFLQNNFSQNKLVVIGAIVGGLAIVFFVIFFLIQAVREYTVKEVLYNSNTGEVFIERNEGGQIQAEITIGEHDRAFRSNDFLLHQTINEGKYITKVYTVDAKEGLIEVFNKEANIVFYQDESNYIYDNGSNTFVLKDDEETKLDQLCRDTGYFKDQLLCLDSKGTIFYGSQSDLKELKQKDGIGLFGLTFVSTADTIYFAFATQEEFPRNFIIASNSIETIFDSDIRYEVDDIPALLTLQGQRVILNARNNQSSGETLVTDYKLYSLGDGLQPIRGYRSNLMIIY